MSRCGAGCAKGHSPLVTAYSAGLFNGTVCGSIQARIAPAYGLGQVGWTLAVRTDLDSIGVGLAWSGGMADFTHRLGLWFRVALYPSHLRPTDQTTRYHCSC
jgi:hypothetical protein